MRRGGEGIFSEPKCFCTLSISCLLWNSLCLLPTFCAPWLVAFLRYLNVLFYTQMCSRFWALTLLPFQLKCAISKPVSFTVSLVHPVVFMSWSVWCSLFAFCLSNSYLFLQMQFRCQISSTISLHTGQVASPPSFWYTLLVYQKTLGDCPFYITHCSGCCQV